MFVLITSDRRACHKFNFWELKSFFSEARCQSCLQKDCMLSHEVKGVCSCGLTISFLCYGNCHRECSCSTDGMAAWGKGRPRVGQQMLSGGLDYVVSLERGLEQGRRKAAHRKRWKRISLGCLMFYSKLIWKKNETTGTWKNKDPV